MGDILGKDCNLGLCSRNSKSEVSASRNFFPTVSVPRGIKRLDLFSHLIASQNACDPESCETSLHAGKMISLESRECLSSVTSAGPCCVLVLI